MSAATDGIFVADEAGTIIEVNDAWTRIVGFGQDGVPYRPPYPWWPDAESRPVDRAVLDVALGHLRDEGGGTYEVPFQHRDGARVWVSVSVTTVSDPDTGRGLLVGTVREVTGEHESRERRQQAVAMAGRLSDSASAAEAVTGAARGLAEAFDASVYFQRDTGGAVFTAGGPVPVAQLPPGVRSRLRTTAAAPAPATATAELVGLAARIRTATHDWRGWIAFAAPRRVAADEYLLLGFITTAAGQALQTLAQVSAQQQITDDLRTAVAEAGERERTWRAEAVARTEQVRAERRFRSLVETSTAVVWSTDTGGRIVEEQPSLAAYTGQPWPEQEGTAWLRTVHPDDRERITTSWAQAVSDGAASYVAQCRIWHAVEGAYRHVVMRATGIRDDDGVLTEWIGTISDVHDQVAAEDAARRSAAITDALLEASPVGFGWADTQFRLQHVNPALADINELTLADHVGRRPRELWAADGVRIEDLMRQALRHGPVTGVEFTAHEADSGEHFHRVASYFPIRIAGSTDPLGVGFTVVDVTERTRLLQALGEERTRYERLASTDVLAVFGGTDEWITEANEAFLTLLGYSAADLAAGRLSWRALTPPGWERADAKSLADLARTGRSTAFKKEYRHRDGHHIPLLIGIVALRQKPLRWLAYAADLSAEYAAQTELRLFQALVERSGDLVAVADVDDQLRYLNPAGRELTGTGDDTVPATLTELVSPAARRFWRDTVIPAVLRTGQHRTETQLTRRGTGDDVDVDQQAFTVAGDTTDVRYVAVVARDITDRQLSIRRAEALARFAGALSTASDRTSVIEVVTTLGPALFGAHTAAFAVLSDQHDGIDVVGDGTGGPAVLPRDDRSPLATTIGTNEPVTTPDPAEPAAITAYCLPLRNGDGSPFGAVEVRWDTGVGLDSALSNLLDTVAGLTTQALQRAELTASAEAMATLAARLTVTRSPTEAIAVMLTQVPAVLGARLPGLVMREDRGQVRYYHDGLPESLAAAYDTLSINDPRPVIEALRTGERIILPDRVAFRDRYPQLTDHAAGHGIVTTVALPLLDSQRRPVAALGLGWTRRRHFDTAGLARLDTVADLCEQTLERTRLVAAEHQLITRLATRLQTTTTTATSTLDIAVRYRPAMTGLNLGGDWYDLINLPGDRIAVVVGDVVGHHIEAAADMAQIRTLITALIRLGVPLELIFQQFTALIGRGFWGTAVIIIADPAARRAEIARAGHPHPVLLRPGRPAEQVAEHRTAPLGLITAPTRTSTIDFAPGDTIVAYTDGLIERRGQSYDDSVTRFQAVMGREADAATADDLAEALLTAATGTDDDQALVVVRHRTTGAVPAPRDLLRRHFTVEQLSDLRRTVHRKAAEAGLDEADTADFSTAVYELLTNAVRHGGGAGELLLQHDDTTLTCHVTDTGTGYPHLDPTAPAPDPRATGGRGLWLVRQLTASLQITGTAQGARVSVTMQLPTSPA